MLITVMRPAIGWQVGDIGSAAWWCDAECSNELHVWMVWS